MSAIRYSTLERDYGPVRKATLLSNREWKSAVDEQRFATVYHPEGDWVTPDVAMVGYHGGCNAICKIVWAKPLPARVVRIIGMRNSRKALEVVHG